MTTPDLSALHWRKSSHSSHTGSECVEVAAYWRKSSHSSDTGGECIEIGALWRKSSHSSSTGGECVEVADVSPAIAIRDSKNPDGPVLTVPRPAFAALLTDLRTGVRSRRA